MEETMKDYAEMLEESYSLMGDGVHDTDSLLAWKKAKELKDSRENFTVTVTGIVKGGVVADFEGIRAFIPVSKLSLERIEDCNPFLGKELEVRVFEADMDGDKLVLSAKEILKEQYLEEGRAEGVAMGTNRMGKLMTKLFEQNRIEDAKKASSDSAFRDELFKEFSIL